MALIICSECGKQFSDKAATCPNCGCPTSEMLGTAEAAENNVDREAAEKKMYDAVELAKKEAQRASDKFDLDSKYLKTRAERLTIDLFSAGAAAKVTEIAAEAKKICDELYASYQLQLVNLDATCRPLLAFQPHGKAIKAVADELAELNRKSEIENNFNANVNGSSYGTVAKREYLPPIESKMIQKYWETQYNSSPYFKEQEEERRRRDEEERKQKEQKKKEAGALKGEYSTLKGEYNKEVSKWKDECKTAEAERQTFVDKLKEEARTDAMGDAEARYKEATAQAETELKAQTARKEAAEKALGGLGMFKVAEKKAQKAIIAEAESLRLKAMAERDTAESAFRSAVETAEKRVEQRMDEFNELAAKQFPTPAKPVMPPRLRELQKQVNQIAAEEKKERLSDPSYIRKRILAVLNDGMERTVTEIGNADRELRECSSFRITAELHKLEDDLRVKHQTIMGKVYYSLV